MRKLIWLVLLLAVAGRSSRTWAQSGITAQNGRQVTCASDDMKRHLCQVDTSRGVRLPISIWAGAVPVMDPRDRLRA
jgi:hypothetical protein